MCALFSGKRRCSLCRKLFQPEEVVKCPGCGQVLCGPCSEAAAVFDHILLYQLSENQMIISFVQRCARDGHLLMKHNTDPYIEALRELEAQPWGRIAVDPRNELVDDILWTDEVVHLAQRCIAIGTTFDPNPLFTFSVIGACLYFTQQMDGWEYLESCQRDFGADMVPLELAAQHTLAFMKAVGFDPDENIYNQEMSCALMIARQYLRTLFGMHVVTDG